MYLFKRKYLAIFAGLSLPMTSVANTNTTLLAANDRLETVLVLGEKIKKELEAEQALTPGGVTIIENTDLYERNVANLGDMLRYVPGVWTASGATGDSTFFSSRGSNLDATNYDGNGIKLLQDGLPVTAADGNNHNRIMDPLAARYATIAHGANALTYGASTLGGAIDFTTPTARDTGSEIFLNSGSHGQLQGRVTGGAVSEAFDGLITIEAKDWDGFRAHHQQDRKGIYANAGWQFNDDVKTRLYLTYIDNNQQLPGALTATQFEEDPYQAQPAAVAGNYQYNVETWRVANKTRWDINQDTSLSIGFSYEDQTLYHPIVASPFFSLLINTEQKNAGTSLRYNVRVDEHDLLVGLNYGETTVDGGNYSHDAGIRKNIMTRVDNEADSLELFLVDRWQIAPRWKLVYGVQAVDANREVRNTNVQNGSLYNPHAGYDSINPRAGVIYQQENGSELFANISHLYEAPTNYELEDDSSPDNKALEAMHGNVIEVGSRGKKVLGTSNYWRWEFSVYYARLQDEILSVDDPNAPGTSLSTNMDNTIHAGIESLISASFSLDANSRHRIEPLVSVTINRFSFNDDPYYGNNDLPAAPGYAIKGEILYRNNQGFFAGPTFDIIDERYADFSNTYTVDSYTLLGLRTGFTHEDWEVYGEIRNLSDKKYVSLFSVRDTAAANVAILQAGEPRSVYVGVKFTF